MKSTFINNIPDSLKEVWEWKEAISKEL